MTKSEEIFYKHLNSEDVKHIADKRFLMDRLLNAIEEALSQHDLNTTTDLKISKMGDLKELLKEFIEWAEKNSDGDVFYVFEHTDKAIEEFLEQRED
jgi:hypothetical protein